jgi:hypothetical protein
MLGRYFDRTSRVLRPVVVKWRSSQFLEVVKNLVGVLVRRISPYHNEITLPAQRPLILYILFNGTCCVRLT